MEAVEAGIQESRDHSSVSLHEPGAPVRTPRPGDSVRQRASTRRKLTEAEWGDFEEAGKKIQAMMKAAGVTEDEIVADFQQMKRDERRQRNDRG